MSAFGAGAASAVAIRQLSPCLGAEVVDVDLSSPLDDATFATIESAWLQHAVLLFRDQHLDEEAQIAFAERFGPLARNVNRNSGQRSNPATMLISNIREDGKLVGALPDGEMLFHSDQCYVERPCKGAMLYGIEIPTHGGDTIFADMRAAWDECPRDLQEAVSGLRAVNIFEYSEDAGYGASAMDMYPNVPAGARTFAHPVVRTHPETGRRALYVNRGMTVCIEGMPRPDSDALLRRLFDHQEQLRFQYSHRWRIGDLLVWDNRCTLHARSDFPSDQRRLLRRVTLLGDRPE